jgi:uncharacterized protein YdaU (DUF1376 family)
MPFFPADYLADTRRLTPAQHGAYLLLILEYWVSGSLPDDDGQLARIVGMTPGEWRKAKPVVQAFFHDGWQHQRIDEELAKAKAKHERRQEAGKAGGIAKANAKQSSSNASQMLEQNDSNALASSSQPQPEPTEKKKETRVNALAFGWPPDFREQFWGRYPNKVGKPKAIAKLEACMRRSVEFSAIMDGLDRYIASKPADRAWLNPETFINQERWADQPAMPTNGKRTFDPARRSASADFFAGMSSVAADISGYSEPSGPSHEEIPLGRVNIDG